MHNRNPLLGRVDTVSSGRKSTGKNAYATKSKTAPAAAGAYNGAMTTVRLTPHGEALLQKELANGPYGSPEEVIERALEAFVQNRASTSTKSPGVAVADIRETRRGVSLGGAKIKDLIHEGRKH